VQSFLSEVNRLRRNKGQSLIGKRIAVKFLVARKFDVARALALFSQHEIIRKREELFDLDPKKEPLCSELKTGKFTILVGILGNPSYC